MRTLFVIATPIGNLADISLRAIDTLKKVGVIVCENPGLTKKLLFRWNIDGKKLLRYTEANKKRIIPTVLTILAEEDLAFVTDAGTPLISDPGAELVEAVWENGGRVVAIPGPSALTAALSVSGLRLNRFLFLGFLPRQPKKLERELEWLKKEGIVAVSFEAPHRLKKTLTFLQNHYPDSFLILVKELTKIHEQLLRGAPRTILRKIEEDPKLLRGEFVLILKID